MQTLLIVLAVLRVDGGTPPIEDMETFLRPGDEHDGDDHELAATAAWLLEKRPKALGVLISARICMLDRARTDARAEIATEKKYGAIGGVENKAKLYDLQQQIRAADDRIAIQRGVLHNLKSKETACADRDVAGVTACLFDTYRAGADGHDNTCDGNARYFRAMELIEMRRGGGALVSLPWQKQLE